MQTCALCGNEDTSLARVSGFDLCDGCGFDPEAALARRGISHDRELTKHRSHNSNTTTFAITDRWTLPTMTGAQVSFSKQGWVDGLLNRFRGELTVGDSVFDDAVQVHTNTEERTRALLDEGMQSAVLGLVAGYGSVEIDGARVTVRKAGSSLADGTPDQAETAALLLHLLRHG